ncbi:hypothetical protein [Labrys miyagiensis]|uniref:hypothetical protein n=1 Tax=Labrys miyagiensis TaxID=346912 RepID=UPI0024E0DDB7|nr:hypothetical protein [Labrys miyagiensis]
MVPASIAVFYLRRYANNKSLFSRFIQSVNINQTHAAYVPYVINKGFAAGSLGDVSEEWRASNGAVAKNIYINDDGTDLLAYFKAAASCGEEHCLFLNSYSMIEGKEWLDYYIKALDAVGRNSGISATGSYEIYGSLEPFSSEQLPWNRAHIRTNAFMIRRDLFLSMQRELPTKFDAHAFESGADSLSRQILQNSGRLAIVGRNGRVYEPIEWASSNTFRHGNQENLLVSDNRTREYELAKFRTRQRLSEQTWGTDLGKAERYTLPRELRRRVYRISAKATRLIKREKRG